MKREERDDGYNVRVKVAKPNSVNDNSDWCVIPAWSRGREEPWTELSPFKLKNRHGELFENDWQSRKVYKCHTLRLADGSLIPNNDWYAWSASVRKDKSPQRFPMGKGAKPEFAWFENERLGVVEMRKRMYVPHLQCLYRAHSVYQMLLKMMKDDPSKKVIITEPDGPPCDNGLECTVELLEELQDVVTVKQFKKLIDSPKKVYGEDDKYVPYGHGYVIALTLLQDLKT